MKALILAAGFGSRLMPLTQNLPKTMVEYKGKKIIEYEFEALQNAGIKVDEIAVVGGYKFEILREFLSKNYKLKNFFVNENYATTNMLHSLFCAKELLNECILKKQDLLVSYADIVYFAPCVERLKNAKGELLICVDLRWQELWQRRFKDILSDAESLKMKEINGESFVIELGKKPKNLSEIEGQYMGLFKFSHSFLPRVLEFYEALDKNALFDGQSYNNIYMTSFLQGLIDKYHNAKAVKINGGWHEVDFKSDLRVDIVGVCE